MSGLYNMLFGVRKFAVHLLLLLELEPPPRFRDAFTDKDGSRIIVYTRTGGSNRERFADWLSEIKKHPLYEKDEDDNFDSTFCFVTFRVPEGAEKLVKAIAESSETRLPSELWLELTAQMKSGVDNEMTRKAKAIGEQIAQAMEQGGTNIIENETGSVVVKSYNEGAPDGPR